MQNQRYMNAPHELKPNPSAPTVGPKTISNPATTLAALAGVTLHAKTPHVLVQVEAADVRMCPEGTAPTTTLGITVAAGDQRLLSISEATLAKWIRSTGVDATIQIAQYME